MLALPTTVEQFLHFLDGNPVENYGDKGNIVHNTLEHAIQVAIREALRRKGTIDVFQFLRVKVFLIKLPALLEAELASALDPIDDTIFNVIYSACSDWAQSFANTHLRGVDTPIMVPTSQIPSLVEGLLQAIDETKSSIPENEGRVIEISQELLSCMRQHLVDLKNEEALVDKFASLVTSVGRNNLQEGLDAGILDSHRWQKAWNYPFHGRALDALEQKLQLNARAIKMDPAKRHMSRIIPIVQASGTGKSRLSEEYCSF